MFSVYGVSFTLMAVGGGIFVSSKVLNSFPMVQAKKRKDGAMACTMIKTKVGRSVVR